MSCAKYIYKYKEKTTEIKAHIFLSFMIIKNEIWLEFEIK